jgi:rhodanese-related sulfurtransferase
MALSWSIPNVGVDHIVIDQRDKKEYEQEHYKDAVNIEEEELLSLLGHNKLNIYNINKDTIIFLYCYGGNCAKRTTVLLSKLDYKCINLGGYEDIKHNTKYIEQLINWNVYE